MAQPSVRLALLGERLLDVIPLVSAVGYAADVSQCLHLCGTTYRKGDKGATNDMLVRSQELQCGARAAHAAEREVFVDRDGDTIRGSTQLIRAVVLNNLPRVLQLVQLGTPLDLASDVLPFSALHWASKIGHEAVAKALLDGKYEGRGADVDLMSKDRGPLRFAKDRTPLMFASMFGHEGVVRLLLARGAKVGLQDEGGWTALHCAVARDQADVLKLLCAAPGAAAALALRSKDGRTPFTYASTSAAPPAWTCCARAARPSRLAGGEALMKRYRARGRVQAAA